jgi:hypothetical protein
MRSLVVGLLARREGEASVEVTGGIAKMAFRPTLNGSVAMAYRRTSKLIFVLAFAVCTLALAPPPASAGGAARAAERKSGATLKRIAVIDLPGPPGRRFDYLAIDDEGRYLFSAHLAAGLLYVIDLRTNAVVKTIPDVPASRASPTWPSSGRSTRPTFGRRSSASSISGRCAS